MPRPRANTSPLRFALVAAVAALSAFLVLVPVAASAAPVLSLEPTRVQPIVHKNDMRFDYDVTLRNTGDAPTAGTMSLAVDLPPGVQFGEAAGAATVWTCRPEIALCERSAPLEPGSSTTLRIKLWPDPDLVADTLDLGFTAFGGGSSGDVSAFDIVHLASPVPFEIVNLAATVCSTPPATPDSGICGSDFDSSEYTTAGGHPLSGVASFDFSQRLEVFDDSVGGVPVEDVRNVVTELPAGFIGNLEAVPEICTYREVRARVCPTEAAVGGVDVTTSYGDQTAYGVLYRIVPEDGFVAAFAWNVQGTTSGDPTLVLRVKLRSNGDYGVTAVSPLAPMAPRLVGVSRATLCSYGAIVIPPATEFFRGCKQPTDPGAYPVPFLSNPTRCAGEAPTTTVRVDSWQNHGALNDEGFPDLGDSDWRSRSTVSPSGTDCEVLTEAWTGSQEPSLSFQPDSGRADAAAGYTAGLHVPQDGLTDPDGVANAHLKDVTVALPEGLALNPSAADGLVACSLAQAGYLGNDFPAPNRMRFTTAAPGCPGASKIGTASVTTPVLADPLTGSVFLAAQEANPFGSDFAIYLVVDDKRTGVEATIPGRVDTDPVTGRITSTFVDNPQAPIGDVEIEFFGGPRASLANPDVCGTYSTMTTMSPWSAVHPYAPMDSELATSSDTITVDTSANDGGGCPTSKAQRPFDIGLSAGMTRADGGSYSPFTLRLTRPGGSQELDTVEVFNPEGLVAKLAGIPYCSEHAIQRAIGRTATGDGKLEQADPSCQAASKVGTTTIGAGAGDNPIYVKGTAYLAGPYKGAPLSLAFVVPAVAGPFDLGVQVVRTALQVDRKTAKVTAVSDGIPQILRGVPVRVRDVRVDIDREGFTLNPSNCSQQQIDSKTAGNSGAVDKDTDGFQPDGCAALPFKPKLTLRLAGRKQTRTGKHPGIRAQVTQAGVGEAGIRKAVVRLPKSLALDVNNAQALCEFVDGTKPDLENHCPKGSIVGRARAKTPLLDDDLAGNVYFVKNIRKDPVTGNEIRTLPMIVVALRGQIAINLYGESDTTKSGKLVNTFNDVPDAPVSRFNLNIGGGKDGILAVTRTRRAKINLCAGRHVAETDMDGQNGRQHDTDIRMKTPCTKKQTKAAKLRAKRAAAKAKRA